MSDEAALQNDLSNYSTGELTALASKGPDGTTKGSQLEFYKSEIKKGARGALKKLEYDLRLKFRPKTAKKHELHEHYGPHIHPSPDNRVTHDDAFDFRRHDVFEREGKFIQQFRNLGAETIGSFRLSWTGGRIKFTGTQTVREKFQYLQIGL